MCKAGNRNEEEEKGSVIEACAMEDGVALDNDVRKEVATDTVSGGARTLRTLVLEAPTAGPRAGVRPRVTNGGGGKAGN